MALPKQPWDSDSLEVAFRFSKDLEDHNSVLSHYLNNLRILRELAIKKIEKCKKDTDYVMKLVGELAGIDKCIESAFKLVEMYKDQTKQKEDFKEESEIIQGVFGNGASK